MLARLGDDWKTPHSTQRRELFVRPIARRCQPDGYGLRFLSRERTSDLNTAALDRCLDDRGTHDFTVYAEIERLTEARFGQISKSDRARIVEMNADGMTTEAIINRIHRHLSGPEHKITDSERCRLDVRRTAHGGRGPIPAGRRPGAATSETDYGRNGPCKMQNALPFKKGRALCITAMREWRCA